MEEAYLLHLDIVSNIPMAFFIQAKAKHFLLVFWTVQYKPTFGSLFNVAPVRCGKILKKFSQACPLSCFEVGLKSAIGKVHFRTIHMDV